ncbi:hypothetical protein YC2023_116069 [Brassica napus]
MYIVARSSNPKTELDKTCKCVTSMRNLRTCHLGEVSSMNKRSGLAVALVFLVLVQVSVSVPFIVLHGIAASCSQGKEANFTQLLTNLSGSPGYCM